MKLAERLGHPAPIGRCLGRSAFHKVHHHKAVSKQPAIRRRNRDRDGQTSGVEILHEFGFPREVTVAPSAKTTNGEAPADAQTPHVVGDPASERPETVDIVTPQLKRFPSHGHMFTQIPGRLRRHEAGGGRSVTDDCESRLAQWQATPEREEQLR